MKVTQWFSIDEDGCPSRSGWYDILYKWEEATTTRWWWGGVVWREFEGGKITSFGNSRTEGEKWRGLADKPA